MNLHYSNMYKYYIQTQSQFGPIEGCYDHFQECIDHIKKNTPEYLFLRNPDGSQLSVLVTTLNGKVIVEYTPALESITKLENLLKR